MNPEKKSWLKLSLIVVVLIPIVIGITSNFILVHQGHQVGTFEWFFIPILWVLGVSLLWVVPSLFALADIDRRAYWQAMDARIDNHGRREYSKPIPSLPDEYLDWPGKREGKPKPPIIWLKDRKAPS